jgi:hypothetical protein
MADNNLTISRNFIVHKVGKIKSNGMKTDPINPSQGLSLSQVGCDEMLRLIMRVKVIMG